MPLIAATTAYRPTVTDAGRHRNRLPKRRPFGRGTADAHWQILRIFDGVLEWSLNDTNYQIGPEAMGIIPPNSDPRRMVISPGCRWGYLRFTATPDREHDPTDRELWSVQLPSTLNPDQASPLHGAIDDIIAWWWRGEWGQVRADARLTTMLVDLVHPRRPTTNASHPVDDAIVAADRIWAVRPLAAIPELAEACGLSQRQFRRIFAAKRRCTPVSWARRLMADQARDLLRNHPDWSIERIGRRLGYAHESTFISAFKNEVGVPPGTWRRQR